MKHPLPLLRYPEPGIEELGPLNRGLLQTALFWGAAASCLFVVTQLGLSLTLSYNEPGQSQLCFLPHFFAQVLDYGFWQLPWFVLQALVLGTQCWSLFLLQRLTLNTPQYTLASRALFAWGALIGCLLFAGFSRLTNSPGYAVWTTTLAAVCGYAALICQALLYRALAQRIGNRRVAVLAVLLLAGLISTPVLALFSFANGFYWVVPKLLQSNALLQQHELVDWLLAGVVLALMLLQIVTTLLFYGQTRAQRAADLPMAIEVLPNPLED
jgi:hypothetical protein